MREGKGSLLAEALYVRLGVVSGQCRQIGERQRPEGPVQTVMMGSGLGGQFGGLAFGGPEVDVDIEQPNGF